MSWNKKASGAPGTDGVGTDAEHQRGRANGYWACHNETHSLADFSMFQWVLAYLQCSQQGELLSLGKTPLIEEGQHRAELPELLLKSPDHAPQPEGGSG